MTGEDMKNFRKILAEQLIVADNPFEGIDRSVADSAQVYEPAEFQPVRMNPEWGDEIPHVTMVVDVGEKTATFVAHEQVPEDMMFYILDCFQQSGMGGVHATRDEVRNINKWVKKKLTVMESDGMIWREKGKWIFEG
jgi:hypothetical protein